MNGSGGLSKYILVILILYNCKWESFGPKTYVKNVKFTLGSFDCIMSHVVLFLSDLFVYKVFDMMQQTHHHFKDFYIMFNYI